MNFNLLSSLVNGCVGRLFHHDGILECVLDENTDGEQALAASEEKVQAPPRNLKECPDEPHRPLVHYSPKSMWMNDPNGLVYVGCEWHLFYQYNPVSNKFGNLSWGHAVSPDLIHWTELSGEGNPAIANNGASEYIYSGSAVYDEDNTSGLGTIEIPPMVAIYTSANSTKQAQSLAYSLNKGYTWTKYAGNPVLDEEQREFRDPKVLWHKPTRRWIMAAALSDEHLVRFYSSPDLKTWTKLSDFGPMGAVEGQYECPDLFPLSVDDKETKWVLIVSVNPGGLHGGSSAQYFIGNFDGERFVADNSDPEAINWLDYGKDYYAAMSWEGAPDGKRYMIGWMSNWQYASEIPTTSWSHAMSVPRVMSLRRRRDGGLDLLQQPVPGLVPALSRGESQTLVINMNAGANGVVTSDCDGAYLMEVAVSLNGGTTGATVMVRAADDGSAGTAIVWDAEKGELAVDRRTSGMVGFSEHFSGVHGAPLTKDSLAGGILRLQILVDEGSVEVFADDGRVAITDTVYPDAEHKSVVLKAHGESGTVLFNDIRFVPLRSYRKACHANGFKCRLTIKGAPDAFKYGVKPLGAFFKPNARA